MDRKQTPKLDDLLHEIKKLSTKMKEGKSDDSTSSKEGKNCTASGKKMPRKRQKARHKKQARGRKRHLKYSNLDVESSSFTDCTDEDIIRDYIENITATFSDSDFDGTAKHGAAASGDPTVVNGGGAGSGAGSFLLRQDFSPTQYSFRTRCSPEMDETDSLSESLLSKSAKKCRRYKRHSMEHLEHEDSPTSEHRNSHRLQVLQTYTFQRPTKCCSRNAMRKFKNPTTTTTAAMTTGGECEDFEMEGVEDATTHNGFGVATTTTTTSNGSDSMSSSRGRGVASSSTENSESSSNSHSPGSEADDEGEESCVEGPASTTVPGDERVHWYSTTTATDMCEQMYDAETDDLHHTHEPTHSMNLRVRDFRTRQVTRTPKSILCESGGFVAYANHKIKNFVHERDPNELTMYVTNKKEHDQVVHLAQLYCLHHTVEDSGRSTKVILTKTLNTRDADQTSLKAFLYNEVKLRCRKKASLPMQWSSKRRKMNSQSSNNNMT